MSESRDWLSWHDDYDESGSPLQRRLGLVQGHIRSWLDGGGAARGRGAGRLLPG